MNSFDHSEREPREFEDDSDDVKEGLLQNRTNSSAENRRNVSYCNRLWNSVCFGFKKVFYWVGLSNYNPSENEEKASTSSERFVQYFERKYGASHPQFFLGSFSLALNHAQRNRKLVFVYLHSDDHDDTSSFCKNCLVKAEVISFLDEHCVTVACSVKDYGKLLL